jgi:hypothetical protein
MGAGSYDQVGSAADSTNVNPYTGQMFNQMGTAQQGFMAALQGNSPNAVMANMSGQMGNFQNIIGGLTGGYGNLLNNQAMIQAQRNARTAGAQYASDTAVNSGAYESAVARGMAEPFAAAATNLGAMQANIGSSLLSQYTGLAGQQAGIYGNLAGQAMGIQGQYGMPEWYEAQYAYQPGFWDYASPILGAAAGGAAGGFFGNMFSQKPSA